ncbi:ABC transporter ATP-binding protein [Paenibacillus sp. sgz302251]|uniref:ABC transporter ATP-binding protein n=1 Tax=Paenibacillus sp. sgz302251 TaxID=3414493 RepID=UPI003C7AE088
MKKNEQPLLEVRGLKKHYDLAKGWFAKERKVLKAVDGVDFKVFSGETFGIVGESGCGKSTTGNVILRLLEATDGEILFEGQDLRLLTPEQMREKRKDIQMIFQDPFSSLNPRLKVSEIIAEPLRSHNIMRGKQLQQQVLELMETVGLSASYANRYPHEFSGGQRQRIGIARALALKPKLIVCDEAVSALDVSIQAQILNLLSRLQNEFKLTFIFIGHGLPAVKHISDRIAVMYMGKIVEMAGKEQLFSHPRHPYTKGLLSSIPIPDPSLQSVKKTAILNGDIPNGVNPPKGCNFHTRCPYVSDKCKEIEPLLKETGKEGQLAACHYPLAANDE